MIVDEATSADAKMIAKIHRTARQTAMPWLPVLHTPEEDLWYFKTMVLPVEKVLIAREGANAVGFISVGQDGWLNHLYIDPDHWGAGFGTKLLKAARSDSSYLQLWVFQGNARARHFYSSHGFREREYTDGQHNEEKVPDIRMDWRRDD
jgi:putative acetyltransferase